MIHRQNIPVLICYIIAGILVTLSINNGFFWDTIQLGSKHANHYYTNGFSEILLPDSIDSGHIPAFGFYLALMWKLLGRSLVVSHLAMLPLVFGIVYQIQKLTLKFIRIEYAGWAMLLIFLDPTLLSQMTLVSPDVALVFFFLLGLNSILDNRKILLSLSVLFLFLTSMRGMMVSFCLLVVDLIYNIRFSDSIRNIFSSLLGRALVYMPALTVFILFNTHHYIQKGWIGFHENSPWAVLFEKVGFKGILYNIGILGWRLLDFGRIGIWFVFAVILVKYKKKIIKTRESTVLVQLFVILLLFLAANMVWADNLLGHRYLLPVYISFALLTASILFNAQVSKRLRLILMSLWLTVLISGNLWVYPERIAQGWDSTLAHLPYDNLRQQAIDYLDKNQIDFNNVQSFFPNNSAIDDIDLNNDFRRFIDFNNCCDYLIYSNVFNISDIDLEIIRNDYAVIKHFKRGMVYIDITRKNISFEP